MTRAIWWVRHGPTHAKTMVGWTDIPADLSDTSALARLQAFLPDNALVVSSDLSRARETARAIAGNRQHLPAIPDLRELHFGDWEDQTFKELESIDPERLFAFWDQPGDISAPGGESWNALCTRVNRSVDDLLRQTDTDLIVVAHLGVILSQVQMARRIPAREAFAQKIDNLSVTVVKPGANEGDALPLVNHRP